MGNYLNPGNSGFEEIRKSPYVDKSGLVAINYDAKTKVHSCVIEKYE